MCNIVLVEVLYAVGVIVVRLYYDIVGAVDVEAEFFPQVPVEYAL